MSGPADSATPPLAGAARRPLAPGVVLAMLLLTLAGSLALRSGGDVLGRSGHDSSLAGTDGAAAELQLAEPGGPLVALWLPDLFAPLRPVDALLPGGNLAAAGLLGAWLPGHLLYVGWLPLLLALLAAADLGAPDLRRSLPVWCLRALFAVSLWQVGMHPHPTGSLMEIALLVSLAGLAGCCLVALLDTGRRTTGAMTLAVVALALAAAQIVWALSAGSATDEAALRPFLSLVDEASRAHVERDPSLAALNAAHLRQVLDQAALTGFASLCALLWFLKRRDGLAVVGVLLVVAADFGWHLFAAR